MILGSLDKDFLNFPSLVTDFVLLENPQLNVNNTNGLFRGGFKKGCAKRTVCAKNSLKLLTLIRESGKNPKRGNVTERVFRKIQEKSSVVSFCICSCASKFFSGNRARWRSQKIGIYFCSAWDISPHIKICHFKLVS